MPTLYSIHLSRPPERFGKPSVHAAPSLTGVGNICPETGAAVGPDMDEVRAALPHYYRRAFDRAGRFWFRSDPGGDNFKPAYLALRDSRGKHLNTVYAIPYTFSPPDDAP